MLVDVVTRSLPEEVGLIVRENHSDAGCHLARGIEDRVTGVVVEAA